MAQPIRDGVVRIASIDAGNKKFGTAFVVGRNGANAYLLTCAHVVAGVGGPDQVKAGPVQARVLAQGSPGGLDDIAVLEAELPPGYVPLRLGYATRSGRGCTVTGFRDLPGQPGVLRLLQVEGSLGQLTRMENMNQQVDVWELRMDQDLPPGLSGSPVTDVITGEVIGVATLSLQGEPVSGLAITAATAAEVWPRLRELGTQQLMHRDLEFAYVPGGDFVMGTTERRAAELADTEGRAEYADEAPRSSYVLPGFYLSRFPVTNAQYARFLDEDGGPVPYRADQVSLPYSWDPGTRRHPDGLDDHPVVLVSWWQAVRYCRWLGARLPTEAEWEKAARGTDAREWAWGNDWQSGRANTREGNLPAMTPVGRFSPAGDSCYGLADMSGNVWEWCSSLYDPYPYDAGDGREDQAGVGARVLRGGAWVQDRCLARCATRNHAHPDDFGFTIGFRVAMSDAPTNPAG
jgi:formylglycine-generating enzyme required for sulfatase activity